MKDAGIVIILKYHFRFIMILFIILYQSFKKHSSQSRFETFTIKMRSLKRPREKHPLFSLVDIIGGLVSSLNW